MKTDPTAAAGTTPESFYLSTDRRVNRLHITVLLSMQPAVTDKGGRHMPIRQLDSEVYAGMAFAAYYFIFVSSILLFTFIAMLLL